MIMMISINTFAWNSVSCNLTHKYMFFEEREERQQTVKMELEKLWTVWRGRLSRADGFRAFARGASYSMKTLRERWVESGSANYSSALPLLCFRNIGTGTRRSFNSHRQHCAMLANLTAQSNHSWHIGSFTPSNISNIISHPCLQTQKSADFSHLWSSGREKTA